MRNSVRNALIVILAVLLLLVVLTAIGYGQTVYPDPPVGWFGQPSTVLAPCPATSPGPHPYLPYNNPVDGLLYYLRADGSVRPVTSLVDGHFSGEGLATHTLLYILDGMEIPIRTGVDANGDGTPDYIFTAPWRDHTVEGHPDQTICDKWRNGNKLPATAVCPSNLSPLGYSVAIDNFPDWTSTQAGRNQQIAQWCGVRTPVPTTPTPPTATPTPVPVGPDPAAAYIEWLYNTGATAGCSTSPMLFCPDRLLTRRELAVILQKALEQKPPPPCVGIFQDVKCGP